MKIALTLEDSGPNGTVKGETFGDIAEDTPATRIAWAAMYMMATPELIMLMASNIDAYRAKRLAQEKVMTEAPDAVPADEAPTPDPLGR